MCVCSRSWAQRCSLGFCRLRLQVESLKRTHQPTACLCPALQGEGLEAVLPAAPLPTVLCASHFGEQDGLLRIRGRKLREAPAAPFPALFWGAGLSFSRAQLILEVSQALTAPA